MRLSEVFLMASSDNADVSSVSHRSPLLVASVALFGTLTCVVVGCGGSAVHPVKGTVIYTDGSPATDLENYVVTFESVDQQATSDQPGVSASGTVQADGTFSLSTYETDDGVVPGKHRVALSPAAIGGDGVVAAEIIDPRFYAFATSGLEVSITPGTNEVKLTVQRKVQE